MGFIWAPSSEFVSSSIPSWQILTGHAQPFRGARDLVFCLKVPLDSLLVWASSGGSGETARMRRLTWTFAALIGYKYQIRLTRSILYVSTYLWTHPVNKQVFSEESILLCSCLYTVLSQQVFECSSSIFQLLQIMRLPAYSEVDVILKNCRLIIITGHSR